MIRAVVFDYGGVISAGGVPGSVETKLANALHISAAEAHELIQPDREKLTRGTIDHATFWQHVEQRHGGAIPESARDIWVAWNEVVPLPQIAAFCTDLKRGGYALGLLSNTETHTARMLRDNGAYDSFDHVVLSCEVGYAKPDVDIYHSILDRLGVKPEETMFVDDQPRMLVPAEELGMHVVHAISPKQIIEDVSKLLGPRIDD